MSAKMSYTPGPWFAVRNPGASPMYPTLGWEILCDSPELHSRGYAGPSVLARTTDFNSLSNARAIAALPDLIAALEAAATAVGHSATCASWRGSGTGDPISRNCDCVRVVIRAALAKAGL